MISKAVFVLGLASCLAEQFVVSPSAHGFASIDVPMVLGDDMSWDLDANFTQAHLVDDVNRNTAAPLQVCIAIRERYATRRMCFAKEAEYYRWGNPVLVARPRTCPPHELCRFEVTRAVTRSAFMAAFDPVDFHWLGQLKPSIPAPLRFAAAAASNTGQKFYFGGPGEKALLFKPLLWNVVLSVADDPAMKFSVLLPIVLPTGELDGVYIAGAPPRFLHWRGV